MRDPLEPEEARDQMFVALLLVLLGMVAALPALFL